MPRTEYEITLYRPEHMQGVVTLLQGLWGSDSESNEFYFTWKYHDNPYSEIPLGVVVLYKDEVVGFTGYFATRWLIRDKGCTFVALSIADAYVSPEHSLKGVLGMKGLFVSMMTFAMKKLASTSQIFLVTSAGKTFVPGCLRVGFVPISDRTYLMRYNFLGLLRKKYLKIPKRIFALSKERIKLGEFDDVIVSESPKPKEMSIIVSSQNYVGRRIKLLQDEQFFRWRFDNRRNRYIFYYSRKDNVIAGYVVMLVLQDNQSGYILDFAEIIGGEIRKILRHILREKHVDITAIFDVNLDENFRQQLKDLGFKPDSLIEKRVRKVTGLYPFLVRPVKRHCIEDDWHIEGIDIRDIGNWEIKGICTDGF